VQPPVPTKCEGAKFGGNSKALGTQCGGNVCSARQIACSTTQCMLAALLFAHRGSRLFRLPAQRQRTMSGLVRCLLGMGNPLLDVMSNVDQAFLDKYKVTCNQEA